MPRRPAILLEAELSALVSHVTSCRLLFVVPLFVLVAPWSAGGGDREDVALSYVYAYTQGVWQPAGCVSCEPVCVLCVARACRHHLSSVHPYRVGVQSEPGCSSPFYLT